MSNDIITGLEKFLETQSKAHSAWASDDSIRRMVELLGADNAFRSLALRGNMHIVILALMIIVYDIKPHALNQAVQMACILSGFAGSRDEGSSLASALRQGVMMSQVVGEISIMRAQVLRTVKEMPADMFNDDPYSHQNGCFMCTLRVAALESADEYGETVRVLPGLGDCL